MLILIKIVAIVILLGFSGFFSGSETALFSLSRIQREKLRQQHPTKAKYIRRLLDRPRALIITLLLGNELVNITISALFTLMIIQITGTRQPWLNLLVALPLVLLVGEIVPKTYAARYNERFARWAGGALFLFMRLMTPLRWMIRQIADAIVGLIVQSYARRENILTEDVIRSLIEDSQIEGVIDEREKDLIDNVFDFGDLRVEEVMTPRARMFTQSVDTPVERLIGNIKASHFSRIPISDAADRERIIGILFTTDLMGAFAGAKDGQAIDIKKLLRRPFFVPRDWKVDDLLHAFQQRKISLALVCDVNEQVIGLVTVEDLLEEIFGEIYDEFEKKNQVWERLSNTLWRVKGNMELEDFNQLFGTALSPSSGGTIGEFIHGLTEEPLRPKMAVRHENLNFIIERTENDRIICMLVRVA